METIIVAILGSSVLSALISGIFNAINNSKKQKRGVADQLVIINNRLSTIEKNQVVGEKDQLRTQLLMMISDYPEEHAEILELAKHYFEDLDGNWYLSSLFNKWLTEENVTKPSWFKA